MEARCHGYDNGSVLIFYEVKQWGFFLLPIEKKKDVG